MPPVITALCTVCQKLFSYQWPVTKKNQCSKECWRIAYRTKNKAILVANAVEWNRSNRSRRLEIQRKWNNSKAGKIYKKGWSDSHLSEKVKKYLSRYREEEAVRLVQRAREVSRKALLKSKVPFKCAACGLVGRLHCHHLDWNPLNRDLSNLQWLCIACHALAHSEGGRVE